MSALADMPPVLTIEETARILRIGRTAAYDAARRGDLPGVIRIGRTLRVSRQVLERMLGEAPLNESSPAGEPGLTKSTDDGGHGEGYSAHG